MRRLVTGIDADGRSTVTAVEAVDGIDVWEAAMSEAPAWMAFDGEPMPFEPAAGWVKCMAVSIPPGDPPSETTQRGSATEAARGLHKTNTIDIVFVRDPMVLVLEDGEVEVDAGDVVIQRGTLHDWRNPRDEPARLLGFSWGVPADGRGE